MPDEQRARVRLEIGHVLFLDIVGYSKLTTEEQSEVLPELNRIVRNTEAASEADAAGRLIFLPTGDGMALVFTGSIEEPVECALQLAQALRVQSSLPVRMGIHSGPVHHVADVNARENIAGAGINIAQRIMDCGDAGHILVSKRVADDLAHYRRWQPYLHDLGEFEVKHGVVVSVVNLYADGVGNPAMPAKLNQGASYRAARRKRTAVLAMLFIGLLIGSVVFFSRRHWFASAENNSSASVSAPEKSIAVLPFENLSSDKENAYFADGVQDEILTDLAKVADLKVISRTSVMPYKTGVARNLREIGKQLGVAYLLEGSVQRAGNQVRVNAQLIDARTDAHQWAENYDKPLDDVFKIQSEIARTIADQLQAKLSANERSAIDKPATKDMQAYELYVRARVLANDTTSFTNAQLNLPRAEAFLNEAVKRDPNFLLAWSLLAGVHELAYWKGFDHTPARLAQANAAIQTALRIQPDSGEGHLALALYYFYGFRDYDRARTELAIAQRTLPNNPQIFAIASSIARRQGNWDEATRNSERSLELDPRNFQTVQQMASIYGYQHRYDDELRMWDRALSITPGDPFSRIQRARIPFKSKADFKPYEDTLTELLAENPAIGSDLEDPDVVACERNPATAARCLAAFPREGRMAEGVHYSHEAYEGGFAHWAGDKAKADALLTAARAEVAATVEKKPDNASATSLLGTIDAYLGRKEDAVREGRRACELMPLSKDAVQGAEQSQSLTQIYGAVGEKDLAIKQIEALEQVPNQLSYGFLKLHPDYDSLRGDPRFEKILASLAPKQ